MAHREETKGTSDRRGLPASLADATSGTEGGSAMGSGAADMDEQGDVVMRVATPEMRIQEQIIRRISGENEDLLTDALPTIPEIPLVRQDGMDAGLDDFEFAPTRPPTPEDYQDVEPFDYGHFYCPYDDTVACSLCDDEGCPFCRDLDEDDYESTRRLIQIHFRDIAAVFEAYLQRHRNRMMHMLNGNIQKASKARPEEQSGPRTKKGGRRVKNNKAILTEMAELATKNNALNDQLKEMASEKKETEQRLKREQTNAQLLDRAHKMTRGFVIYNYDKPRPVTILSYLVMLFVIGFCTYFGTESISCKDVVQPLAGNLNKYILPQWLQLAETSKQCTTEVYYPFRFVVLLCTALLALHLSITLNFVYIKYKRTGEPKPVTDLPCSDQESIKDIRGDYVVSYEILSLSKFRWSRQIQWISVEHSYEVLKKRLSCVELDFDLAHRTIELNNGTLNPANADHVQYNTAQFCRDCQFYLLQSDPRFQYAPTIIAHAYLLLHELAVTFSFTVISYEMSRAFFLLFLKWILLITSEFWLIIAGALGPWYRGPWGAMLLALPFLFLTLITLIMSTVATEKGLQKLYILVLVSTCEALVTLLTSCLGVGLTLCLTTWTFLFERGSIIRDILFGENEKSSAPVTKQIGSCVPVITSYANFPSLKTPLSSFITEESGHVETSLKGLSGQWLKPLKGVFMTAHGLSNTSRSPIDLSTSSIASIVLASSTLQPTTLALKLSLAEK